MDAARPPVEHVALFDEAHRAWNLERTAKFMRRKKKLSSFQQSEPEFLISCMDRHLDWAVVVCLVGGGQEINTGEAGESASGFYPYSGHSLTGTSICPLASLTRNMVLARSSRLSSLVPNGGGSG